MKSILLCIHFLYFILMNLWIKEVIATIQWKDCGSSLIISDVRITGCDNKPCIFYKGRSYRFEFDAISTTSTIRMPYKVKANFIIPFTLLNGDACDELSYGSCPILQNGTPFTFFKDFLVEVPFPILSSLATTITAEINDDVGQTLLCAQLEIVIKDADEDPNPLPGMQTVEKPSFVQGFLNFFRF